MQFINTYIKNKPTSAVCFVVHSVGLLIILKVFKTFKFSYSSFVVVMHLPSGPGPVRRVR